MARGHETPLNTPMHSSRWAGLVGVVVVFLVQAVGWTGPTGRLIERRMIEERPSMDRYELRREAASRVVLPSIERLRLIEHGDTGNVLSNEKVYQAYREVAASNDVAVPDPRAGEEKVRHELTWTEHVEDVSIDPSLHADAAARNRRWQMILDRSGDHPVAFSVMDGKVFVEIRRDGYALEGALTIPLTDHDEIKRFVEHLTEIAPDGTKATDVYADREATARFRELGISMEGWRTAFGYTDLHQVAPNFYTDDEKTLAALALFSARPLPAKRVIYLLDADVDGHLAAALRDRCHCSVVEASEMSIAEISAELARSAAKHLAIFIGHHEHEALGHEHLVPAQLTEAARVAGATPLVLGCNSASFPGGVVVGQVHLNPLLRRLTSAFEMSTVGDFFQAVATPTNPLVVDSMVVDGLKELVTSGPLELHDQAATATRARGSLAPEVRVEATGKAGATTAIAIEMRNVDLLATEVTIPEKATLSDVRAGLGSANDQRDRILLSLVEGQSSYRALDSYKSWTSSKKSLTHSVGDFFSAIFGLAICVVLLVAIVSWIRKRIRALFRKQGEG